MAKNNNLTDFLTGVANAIRAKKGTTDLINPQDFESEIASIETGGGGTSAILGELNVSYNGTYEAGGKMTLAPGGIYQFKEQLPVETLAELYSATQGNNGVIFSVLYQEIPLSQLAIHKNGDIYILESSSLAGMAENIYSTGTTTFTYTSLMDGGDVTVDLAPGWNTYIQNTKCEPPAQSTIRLPQDISGIPSDIINLVDLQFDTNNCVEAVLDASTTITTQQFGQFFKVTSSFNPAKRFTIVSLGGYDEFNLPEGEMGLEIAGIPVVFRNSAASSELQTDIEGIRYFKNYMRNVALMYVEDASKIQVTSGTAENGCWYLNQYMVMDPSWYWAFAYGKDPVDGYNKVTVNVHSQAKLQSKTATSNGVYSPDEGFDGLSQVTVDFALQDKTITANGTYTCDEGYGGLGQINVSTVPKLQNVTIKANGNYVASTGYDGLNKVTVNVTPKLQSKTIRANGTYACDEGYDGLNKVTVSVTPKLQDKTIKANGTYTCDEGYDGLRQVTVKAESRTLLNNGKLAVHTVVGADDLSLDPNKATIEELIVNEGAKSVSNGTGYTSLKRVVLPDTLRTIASSTFLNCANLESAIISNNMREIEGQAFSGCSKLTNIIIPDSTTYIGGSSFSGCAGLTSITIPFVGPNAGETESSLYQYPFGFIFGTSSYEGGIETNQRYYRGYKELISSTYYIPSSLKNVTVTGGNILYGAFYNCSMLTSITIPDNVTSIGEYAFYNCSGLTNMIIPDSVTDIKWHAFKNCSGMTSVTIGNSVTSIRSETFYGCSGLTSVTIPNSVTSIEEEAFYNCSGLTSIIIPDSVTYIGYEAFYNTAYYNDNNNWQDNVLFIGKHLIKAKTSISGNYEIKSGTLTIAAGAYEDCRGLTNITIPDSVASIGSMAFYNCSGLTSAIIPDSVTYIGSSAFQNCSNLTNITIPNSITSIDYHAFYNCSKLTSITIPGSVTSISSGAFENCSGLTSIIIPDSVTLIGYSAFGGCRKLTSVTILATTPPTNREAVFSDTALTQIIVPAGCGEAYKTAEGWSTYADYIIEEGMHRVTLGEEVTCSVGGTSYSNQTFDVADQTVIHFEVGRPAEGGAVSSTPDGIFLNGTLVSSDSEPATYDLTVTGNVSVTYSTGDVVGDITYNNCYKIVMN